MSNSSGSLLLLLAERFDAPAVSPVRIRLDPLPLFLLLCPEPLSLCHFVPLLLPLPLPLFLITPSPKFSSDELPLSLLFAFFG